jgi:secretion/DNA translocation related CpaE-like protein
VVTGDGELLDELLSLARAGGVEVTVAVDAIAAEGHWASAPLVVVGPDQVAALVRRGLPRRLGVVLVTRPGVPTDGAAGAGEAEGAWSAAEALCAEHVLVLPEARSWLAARFAECRPRALRHAAPVIAVVPAGDGAAASTLVSGLAVVALRRGLAALVVGSGVDAAGLHPHQVSQAVADASEPAGSLAILTVDRGDGTTMRPEVMAGALRAARHGRDLVVLDLLDPYDDAARLALSCADRCYLVVSAEIRACAAATRVAAAVRRHCPSLAVVVHEVAPLGLRPGEVAEALGLPLAGVLPAGLVADSGARPRPSLIDPRVAGLCRRLLTNSGARRRVAHGPVWQEPTATAARADR